MLDNPDRCLQIVIDIILWFVININNEKILSSMSE